MTAVTYSQAHREFTEIANTAPPGYIYERQGSSETCLYVHGGYAGPLEAASGRPPEPLRCGCIVAHWLHRYHRVPLPALAAMESLSAPNIVIRLLAQGALLPDFLEDDTGCQVLKFVQVIQACQDSRLPWRDAVVRAHDLVTSRPWSYLLGPEWPSDGPVPMAVSVDA